MAGGRQEEAGRAEEEKEGFRTYVYSVSVVVLLMLLVLLMGAAVRWRCG